MAEFEKNSTFTGRFTPRNPFQEAEDGHHFSSDDDLWMWALDAFLPDEAKTEDEDGNTQLGKFTITVKFETPEKKV